MGNAKWVLPAAALLLAAGCSARATPDASGEVSQATTGVAQPDHVMVVVMENTSYGALIGAADAPYINSLISQGASFSNAHAVSHPSEPNYLALFSGSTQGVTSDACPLSFGATANLGSELIAAGLTFTAYSEDLPSAGSTVCTSGGYARKHAPWVNFSNVPAASQQPFTAYPSGNYAALPTVSFVIPNLCDDMHDCSVQTGDTWLQNNIDGYVQWAKAHNSLLVLTWDEDDSSSSANQIATVFVGQMVRPGTYGESISHYSVLRTIEDMFGLAPTGDAASASPITDVWSSGVTSDFSLAISPSSVGLAQGSSAAATVSTAVVRGGAESVTLSASGLPAGVTAAFAPSSVASGGSSTVTLAASSSAAAGTYSVTVTGTAASGTHSVNLPLTVSAVTVDDFSIAASPVALSLAQGQSASANVTTAITSGKAQTVALSTSGLPAGVTATFSPTSVTSGASATLAFAAGSGAAAGTYAITVTGAGASVSHTTSLALTVTTATGGGGLANGGFEAGSLTGWTSTGSGSVVSSGAHGGTYAARVGSTSPTAGDSSIAQTFTAPAGVSTLSFWYQVVCPDTAQYDWATATLADTTAGTTATVLPHVCSNTGAWSQVSAPITPGHTYTLTLVSHDDDYAGDPTYTLYDDVALGTVAPPPPRSIVNGDFEAGSLGGWTSSGTTSVVSSGAHGGTYAARLGSTSPTNGDSSIAQTFTASAGSSRLSFWYEMTCPDTVQYDWATAALKDNTAGTTATVLGKVCATGGWTQVTAAVTAGHSYTLTLVSHDDDYQGDPTYTLYDDVTVQ